MILVQFPFLRMLNMITGIYPTSSSICSDQSITKYVLIHFLTADVSPLAALAAISSSKLCSLFCHFLCIFLNCQMKALVFLHNAFLCLVYLIPRYTPANNLLPPCDLQKGQRPLDPPKAASTSLVRTQQPLSHVAQISLHSFTYTRPVISPKPGQALSPYGFVVGGSTILACQKGPGVGMPREQHSGRPGNSFVSHHFIWKENYLPAGSSQRKKQRKENCWIKSSAQMFFPIPPFASCYYSQNVPVQAVGAVHMALKEGMGEHPMALQCKQGQLQGLCLSRQSDRTKVLRSPIRTHLTLTKENTHN